jgi:hypothetical protein
MRVFEEMSLASVVWPHSMTEGPAHSAATRTLISSLSASTMHVQAEEILSTILGSEEEVIKRKIYSVCYCTLAPLVHEGEMCDACLDLTEFEAPILIYPMPCAGATASRDRRRWGCRRGHGGRWRGSTACRTRSRDVRAMPRSRAPRPSWRR